jgi:hypothetical protein
MHLSAPPTRRALAFIGLSCLPLFVHVALAMDGGAPLCLGLDATRLVALSLVAASALPHTLVYLGLLAAFGVTLLPGREPLITVLAGKMYGPISREMRAYTRGVTWAWCAFFAAQLVTSLLLFLWAPLPVWSFFVNVLNLPLVVVMFVAEHAYRMVHLRNAPRHGLSDVIRIAGYLRESLSKPASSG